MSQSSPKPRRGCFGVAIGCVVVLAALYFTQCPSFSVRITPESHFITEPKSEDGRRVDYARALKEMAAKVVKTPEDNGFRLVLQAEGPRALDVDFTERGITWEELPTHSTYREWWKDSWVPLCREFHVDPTRKAEFYDSPSLEKFLQIHGIRGDEPVGEDGLRLDEEAVGDYVWKLGEAPWDPAEHPQMVAWVKNVRPKLDLYARAVRCPIFESDRSQDQAQVSRKIAIDFGYAIRTEIFSGDIDAAIDDILSVFHLARQRGRGRCDNVACLVGAAIEGMANSHVVTLLHSGKATDAQLVRLETALRTLPPAPSREQVFHGDMLVVYDFCQSVFDRDPIFQNEARLLRYAPFLCDENLARAHFAKHVARWKEIYDESDPYVRKEKQDSYVAELTASVGEPPWFKCLEVRSRSRILADGMAHMFFSYAVLPSLERAEADTSLSLVAIALERYRLAHGAHPAGLDALVPEFLPEKPLDLCTHRDTLVYRLRDDGTFLLYSLGPNLQDDGAEVADRLDVVYAPVYPAAEEESEE